MSAPAPERSPAASSGPATHPAAPGPRRDDPYYRWSLVIAIAFMIFLAFPLLGAVQADAAPLARGVTVAAILAFAALYLWGYSERHPWWVLAGMLALTVATVPVLGVGACGLLPYVATHAALELPRPSHYAATAAAALTPLVVALVEPSAAVFALIAVPVGGGMLAVRQMIDRGIELGEVETALAITAERERVARDVHDVLGHSLTAIVLKADLAERLVGRDDDRARDEISQVAALARQALSEARSTVVGLRSTDLADEVERARDLASSGEVTLTVHGDPQDVPPRHRPVAAWILREAVTNVSRHARASTVDVILAPDRLVVCDDGQGLTGEPSGSGSDGIRERAAAAGGTVVWEDNAPGTRLVVTLPTGAAA